MQGKWGRLFLAAVFFTAGAFCYSVPAHDAALPFFPERIAAAEARTFSPVTELTEESVHRLLQAFFEMEEGTFGCELTRCKDIKGPQGIYTYRYVTSFSSPEEVEACLATYMEPSLVHELGTDAPLEMINDRLVLKRGSKGWGYFNIIPDGAYTLTEDEEGIKLAVPFSPGGREVPDVSVLMRLTQKDGCWIVTDYVYPKQVGGTFVTGSLPGNPPRREQRE